MEPSLEGVKEEIDARELGLAGFLGTTTASRSGDTVAVTSQPRVRFYDPRIGAQRRSRAPPVDRSK